MTLKKKTATALIWNLVDRLLSQFSYFVTGLILAKLLSVTDFGLVGALSLFVALSSIFIEGGFSSALIRKQDATEKDYSTIFYINMLVSILLYALLYIVSPFIADFYDQPQLVNIGRVLFLSLIFNSAGLIQNTLLSKDVNFRLQTIANISSLILSGGITIFLAYKGYGVWALVYQTLSISIIKTAFLWISSSWRPRLVFSLNSIRSMFSYSTNLLGSQFINTIFLNIYSLIIGRFFSVQELGYYAQAQKMNDMAVSVLNNPVQTATFPIFSMIQDDQARLVNAFRKTMRFAMFLCFWFLPMLVLMSRPLLLFLIGEKWANSVPFLQLLAVGGVFTILAALVNNFVRVCGRTDLLFRLEIAKLILAISILVCTIPYGAIVVVIGQAVAKILIAVMNMYFIGREIHYSLQQQSKDIAPYMGIAIVAIVVSYLVSYFITGNFLLLMVQGLVYTLVYLGLAYKGNSVIMKEMLNYLPLKKKL
ncbi:MAG: lipopolysaccharide biosynthesis protein [Bacteroidales bacterium]